MKNKRIERLRAEMRQRSLDAMLISCEENQSWCCNFDFTDGYLLVFDDKAYLITDGRYIEAAKAEADESFICVVPKTNIGETISAYLNEQGSVRVGIEDMEMSYYKVMALKGELYPCEVVMTGRMPF